jgi:hypothetical protein
VRERSVILARLASGGRAVYDRVAMRFAWAF